MPIKRLSAILVLLILISGYVVFARGYESYNKEFYDVFDTYTVVRGYARSEKEFQGYADKIYGEMLRLHKLFDIYNSYEGVNNLKTVNDNAGISAIEVDAAIIELLLEAKLAYAESGGAVNAAMGSVLQIWHDYRESGIADAGAARLPPLEELENAASHTNIDNIVIDETASTVFLEDPGMALDVGALAKGFAVEKAVKIAKQAGLKAGFISAGGNVSVFGKPMNGRDAWNVGVQSPEIMPDDSQQIYDVVSLTDKAIVSSGDYKRYYIVDGKAYHHIIDPETLMPAEHFAAVTVIHPDSGVADMLSTSIYIMPYERGLALIKKHNADAIWISHDNSVHATEGYIAVSRMQKNLT